MILKDKKVLITGGTGSLGSVLVEKCLEQGAIVKVLSRDAQRQVEMMKKHPKQLECVLGDIRQKETVWKAMCGIDIVIHTAAMKIVPTCERHVWECVQTNVIGSQNLVDAALSENVGRFVAVSTDKASSPGNVYGYSKALMERLVLAGNQPDRRTKFSCIRSGNFIVSKGSVVLLFLDQIRKEQRITLTNPDMTRFFISTDAVAEFVLWVLGSMKGGEIFVPKMKSATLQMLVKALLEVEGVTEVKAEIIGARPGERIFEYVISPDEGKRTVLHDDYYQILEPKDVVYPGVIGHEVSSENSVSFTKDELRELLRAETERVSC